MTLHLHGLGHFHPENEISNKLLEELDIGTDNDWIVERVGIRARRTVLSLDYIRQTKNADVRAAAGAALYTNAQLGARAPGPGCAATPPPPPRRRRTAPRCCGPSSR